MRGVKRVDIDREELKQLYQSGVSGRALQVRYNCSPDTLYRTLKEAGAKINDPERARLIYRGPVLFGPLSPAWKGGRTKDARGYILVRIENHHRTDKSGYVKEHIYIWEKVHNKKLPKGWVIHHINGIKDDNRPENLMAMKPGSHAKLVEPYKKRIRELELEISRLKQGELIYAKSI